MAYQIYRFTWHGIEIEARYNPHHYGEIAHLEIETVAPERAPLPITETGYRSHFHPRGLVRPNEGESLGDAAIRSVVEWLDTEAAKPDWKARVEAERQLELF